MVAVPVFFPPVLLSPSGSSGLCSPELTLSVPREDGLVPSTATAQQPSIELFSIFKLHLFLHEYLHSSPFCFCWSLPSRWTGQKEAAGVFGGVYSSLQVVVVLLCWDLGGKKNFSVHFKTVAWQEFSEGWKGEGLR